MPVQGFVRARKHQAVREATFNTPIAATRVYPVTGVPSVNLNWTDPEVDTGSIVAQVAPVRGVQEVTASYNDPALAYNNVPRLMCAMFGGQVGPTTVGGSGRKWTHKPSSVAPLDDPDSFCEEFGDDVVDDWFQLSGGILESIVVTIPDGIGPMTVAETWRYAEARSTGSTDAPVVGSVPTPGLEVEASPAYVYFRDLGIFIADTLAGIGAGQITDALHGGTITITATRDEKRFANADHSDAVDEFAVTGYTVAFALRFAKTSDTVGTGSEADAWFSDDSVDRVLRLTWTSEADAGTGNPYSWRVTAPIRYYTREDGEIGGNTIVTLTGNAFYEPDDFDGFFESVVVNQLSEAELGAVAS